MAVWVKILRIAMTRTDLPAMTDQQQLSEGGCDCGEIRYRMNDVPMIVHCCHCRWCQRETGAAFALNAFIETDRIDVLQGAPAKVPVPSSSGRGQVIVRCPKCQVAVWSHYGSGGPTLAMLRVGTLDDPDRLPPDVHIYTDSKQPWLELTDSAPTFAEYYDRNEVWSEDGLARLKALFA